MGNPYLGLGKQELERRIVEATTRLNAITARLTVIGDQLEGHVSNWPGRWLGAAHRRGMANWTRSGDKYVAEAQRLLREGQRLQREIEAMMAAWAECGGEG